LPGGAAIGTLEGHLAAVSCLAISPDGQHLISGGADQTLRLWRLQDGRPLEAWEAHSSEVTHVIAGPDGEWFASASGNGLGFDHSVRLWSARERSWIKSLFGHDRAISCLATSSNGRFLASGSSDATVRIWSSELTRLCRTPLGLTTVRDLETAEHNLCQGGIPDNEKNAWAFIAAMIRRRRRYDVHVDPAGPKRIEAGEFDIEIEG
jgi:WD40 repeat protein